MKNPSSIWRHLAASAYLIAVAGLTYSYCTVPIRWTGLQFSTMVFYRDLKFSWLTTDEEDLQESLISAKMDSWQQIWLRTAMARWRLRETTSALPFEALMDRWDNGILPFMPSRRDWVRMLEENDRAWLAARREHLNQQAEDVQPYFDRQPGRLVVSFPQEIPSARLGSMLSVVFECPESDIPAALPGIMWGTQASPRGAHQIRTVTVRKATPQEGVSGSGFVVGLDLSWEPAYLNKNARGPTLLMGEVKDSWTFVRIIGTDSPLLPVP